MKTYEIQDAEKFKATVDQRNSDFLDKALGVLENSGVVVGGRGA